jgi:hypothetical protein
MLGLLLAAAWLAATAEAKVVTHLEDDHGAPATMLLELPYYECNRNGVAVGAGPGVCSMFGTHYASVPVDARFQPSGQQPFSYYTVADAAAFCASAGAAALDAAMAMATLGWTSSACASYVHAYVSAELQASAVAVASAASSQNVSGLDQVLVGRYSELDGITASFGDGQWVEGNIWRLQRDDSDAEQSLLQRKRRCLLTALQAAAGGPADGGGRQRGGQPRRVAEIGFNAGHSAASILSALPAASLTSFDICSWCVGTGPP